MEHIDRRTIWGSVRQGILYVIARRYFVELFETISWGHSGGDQPLLGAI